MKQRITPFLWFDHQAEKAVKFYTGIFKKSRVLTVSRYGKFGEKAAGRPAGSVMTIDFELNGQRFVALNGGPHLKINEAISFVVNCQNQAELDYYWEKLSAGGKEVQCGWLKDKFGVSWQVVPEILGELVSSKNPAASERVMDALLGMRKLDIAKLQRAYKSEPDKSTRRGTRRK
jgi:predicted 3-demethylubiquinone-9 3-methyltransferase (glyoxalase superfamily)